METRRLRSCERYAMNDSVLSTEYSYLVRCCNLARYHSWHRSNWRPAHVQPLCLLAAVDLLRRICLPRDAAEPDQRRAELEKQLAPYYEPPAEFAGQFGRYQSPLKFADGSVVKTTEDWARRRAEILKTLAQAARGRGRRWSRSRRSSGWRRSSATATREQHVHVQISPEGQGGRWLPADPAGQGAVSRGARAVLRTADQHRPRRKGARHARLRPATGEARLRDAVDRHARLGREDRQRHAAAPHRSRQGAAPPAADAPGLRRGQLPHGAGADARRSIPQRIGIIGLSYGGKWSMFASCLYDKFACAVWSDPGIVFNEKNANVNYWEPWYLGYDPKEQRKPGVPSDDESAHRPLQGAGRRRATTSSICTP